MSRCSLSLPNFDAMWPKIPFDAFGIGKINWTGVAPGIFDGLFDRAPLVAMVTPADMFRNVMAVSKRSKPKVPVERALSRYEIEEIAKRVAAQMLRTRRQERHPTVDVEFIEAAVEVARFATTRSPSVVVLPHRHDAGPLAVHLVACDAVSTTAIKHGSTPHPGQAEARRDWRRMEGAGGGRPRRIPGPRRATCSSCLSFCP